MGVNFQDSGIQYDITNFTTGALANAKLHLFQHGPTISNATVLSALTEATFAGYAAVAMSGWSASTVTDHVASSTANPCTFTLTSGSQAIGGWYVTDSTSTYLLCAGNDPNDPVNLNTTVNTYQVTVTVSAAS
jgi:hypothetical protein